MNASFVAFFVPAFVQTLGRSRTITHARSAVCATYLLALGYWNQRKWILEDFQQFEVGKTFLHFSTVLNGSGCYTAVIKPRLDSLPQWLFYCFVCRSRAVIIGATFHLISNRHLQSTKVEIVTHLPLTAFRREFSPSAFSCFYDTASALFHGCCSQILLLASLLRLSQSLRLHNWCVSDCGMKEKVFIINLQQHRGIPLLLPREKIWDRVASPELGCNAHSQLCFVLFLFFFLVCLQMEQIFSKTKY